MGQYGLRESWERSLIKVNFASLGFEPRNLLLSGDLCYATNTQLTKKIIIIIIVVMIKDDAYMGR